MTTEAIEQKTFRLERWRSIAAGITETANAAFFTVVAITFFQSSQTAKGLLMANTSFGMLLAPVVLWWAARRGWLMARGISLLSYVAAIACVLGMVTTGGHFWLEDGEIFILSGVIAYAAAASAAPLYAAIYQANYRKETRGKLFAANYFLRILSGIIFAWLTGRLLQRDPGYYPIVLACYAACFVFSGWVVSRMPAAPLEARGGRNPLTAMRHVKEDRLFRWTLVSWMLLGFANLAMFPLRTEYLKNPHYGINLSIEDVFLYTSVIPNCARLALNPFVGSLFDKMNFFKLRIILNMGFMLGMLSFFTGTGALGLATGAILFGFANAGADVVWNLWVTKIATPEKTAEYMAVHSFLTGVRGVIAPLCAYHLAYRYGVMPMAWGCALLVVLGSVLLWRERAAFAVPDLPEELTEELP